MLFHHALGLTPGIIAFADDLRAVGHTVHTPDLFEGRTFTTIGEGVNYAQEIGFGEVIERGTRAVESMPAELVYGGFSLGKVVAQKLAQTRAGARGALLFYSCVPTSEFGAAWPTGVPVQIHGMDADPYFVGEGDIDAACALVELGGKLLPVPLGDDLDVAVNDSDGSLIVNRIGRYLHTGSPPFCLGHGMVRHGLVIQMRKYREINQSQHSVSAGDRTPEDEFLPDVRGHHQAPTAHAHVDRLAQ